ncbi:hemerythrin domain-containing protein [Roseobacter denitrificans]|uniref:hemerythrin domain-containing protein n=1 Tax=Roseobacter denitrificans TaxID=2434 RepID=UPI0005C75850|nr:hemerythrin domain-containing protein [Roseobacter denitrificans]SFG36292.1 Hemerythrin HHE cation binding domain-containing protein [Roseobacter denitrificans OCh 114]
MKSITTDHRSIDGKTPTSVMLLQNPLDFIAEDHLRLRAMCAALDRLAETTPVEGAAISEMIDYLGHELPLLLADEDDDLMPHILSRAEPEDELPKLTRRLEKEHAEIACLLKAVTSGLAGLALATSISNALRTSMHDLADAARRHLILENAVLLPLAKARLTKEDLHAIRAAMLKRRGLESLFAT